MIPYLLAALAGLFGLVVYSVFAMVRSMSELSASEYLSGNKDRE